MDLEQVGWKFVLLVVIVFVAFSSYTYLNHQTTRSVTFTNLSQNSPVPSTSATQGGPQTVQAPASVQLFGNQHFEPPSGILVPANTLTWTNFRLNGTTTDVLVSGSIYLFPFPNAIGTNVTVAIYLNGALAASSTTQVPNNNYGIGFSSVPTSTSANSVFALMGLIPTVAVGTQSSSALNINGATVTIAIVCDRTIWLAGWTEADMSGGAGPPFGKSVGQLAGTYEATQLSAFLPSTLPQAATTLTFEFQVSGSTIT